MSTDVTDKILPKLKPLQSIYIRIHFQNNFLTDFKQFSITPKD